MILKIHFSPNSWGQVVVFLKPLTDKSIVASIELSWVISETSKAYIPSSATWCYPILIRDWIRVEGFQSSNAFDGFRLPN